LTTAAAAAAIHSKKNLSFSLALHHFLHTSRQILLSLSFLISCTQSGNKALVQRLVHETNCDGGRGRKRRENLLQTGKLQKDLPRKVRQDHEQKGNNHHAASICVTEEEGKRLSFLLLPEAKNRGEEDKREIRRAEEEEEEEGGWRRDI
jgi:hypothetical protein